MRFLFIFLNSHQLKHHGRASSSWFFIFLLQSLNVRNVSIGSARSSYLLLLDSVDFRCFEVGYL
ncbi:hypothetical protein V6Z12_D12G180000 [Gossypium hirsutum]